MYIVRFKTIFCTHLIYSLDLSINYDIIKQRPTSVLYIAYYTT